MDIKGAIFDLDGTLLDSMLAWNTVGEEYLFQRGITPETGLREKFLKMSIIEVAKYYSDYYGIKGTIEEIVGGINSMIEDFYANSVMPKEGVLDLLEHFYFKDIKMCVATASDRHLVEVALKRNKLCKYFGAIFTCTEVGASKRYPDIYENALSFLGTSKENTIIFEDAPFAIETAKKANFIVAGVRDEIFLDSEERLRAACDYYITDYKNDIKMFI